MNEFSFDGSRLPTADDLAKLPHVQGYDKGALLYAMYKNAVDFDISTRDKADYTGPTVGLLNYTGGLCGVHAAEWIESMLAEEKFPFKMIGYLGFGSYSLEFVNTETGRVEFYQEEHPPVPAVMRDDHRRIFTDVILDRKTYDAMIAFVERVRAIRNPHLYHWQCTQCNPTPLHYTKAYARCIAQGGYMHRPKILYIPVGPWDDTDDYRPVQLGMDMIQACHERLKRERRTFHEVLGTMLDKDGWLNRKAVDDWIVEAYEYFKRNSTIRDVDRVADRLQTGLWIANAASGCIAPVKSVRKMYGADKSILETSSKISIGNYPIKPGKGRFAKKK